MSAESAASDGVPEPELAGDSADVARDLAQLIDRKRTTRHRPGWGESDDAVQGEPRIPDATAAAVLPQVAFDLEDFFLTYYRRLVAAMSRFCAGDDALAEDVVQETFLKAYRMTEQLADCPNPYGWFLAVAQRVAIDQFRREGVRATREREREWLLPPAADEISSQLWMMLIEQLPEPGRQVMWYRFVLRYDRAATAESLGRSLRWVDLQTRKSLDHLRRSLRLDEEG
jgi:RNA polymerase sigma factor (sigma-70 family)